MPVVSANGLAWRIQQTDLNMRNISLGNWQLYCYTFNLFPMQTQSHSLHWIHTREWLNVNTSTWAIVVFSSLCVCVCVCDHGCASASKNVCEPQCWMDWIGVYNGINGLCSGTTVGTFFCRWRRGGHPHAHLWCVRPPRLGPRQQTNRIVQMIVFGPLSAWPWWWWWWWPSVHSSKGIRNQFQSQICWPYWRASVQCMLVVIGALVNNMSPASTSTTFIF